MLYASVITVSLPRGQDKYTKSYPCKMHNSLLFLLEGPMFTIDDSL